MKIKLFTLALVALTNVPLFCEEETQQEEVTTEVSNTETAKEPTKPALAKPIALELGIEDEEEV